MMMFVYSFPLDEEIVTPRRKSRHQLVNEATYWDNKSNILQDLKCPCCQESKSLFKGVVFIGCRSCLTYFSEDDIIEANGGLI